MADHSEQLDKLAEAMAAAQAEMPVAIAAAKNPFFKSRYADLGSIWSACRGVLSKHGLSIVQCPGGSGHAAALTSYLLHVSGQWIRTTAEVGVQEGPQPYGSALTYLRRYQLAALVGIVAEEDDDGETAQKPVREANPTRTDRKVEAPKNGAHQDEAAEIAASALTDELVAAFAEAKTPEDWQRLYDSLPTKAGHLSENQKARVRGAARFAKKDIAREQAEGQA